MLKLKKKYINTIIMKEGVRIVLSNDLTQEMLEYIKEHINKDFVQTIKIQEDDNNK